VRENDPSGVDEWDNGHTPDQIEKIIRQAVSRFRGHADFFSWPDRELAELGVAREFLQNAVNEPGFPFHDVKPRGPGNDPPDCEARDSEGRRIAIEITELTDPEAIKAARAGHRARKSLSRLAGRWNRERFLNDVTTLLELKDSKTLKGGPYEEYLVVVHTDEPELSFEGVLDWLGNHRFSAPRQIGRAYLLLSYDPRRRICPFVGLAFGSDRESR